MKKRLTDYEKQSLEKNFNYKEIWEQGKETQISKNGELIGIYVVSNLVSNLHYIGSSHNIIQRLKNHISCMKNNKYTNKDILEDFKLYGIESFEFKILEYCCNSKLSTIKLKYLKEYNKKGMNLYNLNELKNWNNGIYKLNRIRLGR